MSQEQIDQAAAWLEEDGRASAAKALQRALGSHDIALSILAVAAGIILEQIMPLSQREAVLRAFLASFDP